MAVENFMYVLPSFSEFIFNDYLKEKRRINLREHRFYSQKEHAEKIGIKPMTFTRYINQDDNKNLNTTVDQVDILLRYYKSALVDLFDYSNPGSFWDRPTVQALAGLYEMLDRETADEEDDEVRRQKRKNIADTIHALSTMPADRRKRVLDLILKISEAPEGSEINWDNLLTAA